MYVILQSSYFFGTLIRSFKQLKWSKGLIISHVRHIDACFLGLKVYICIVITTKNAFYVQ